MAQRTEVVLLDDLDGTPATATVAFGFEGKSYEIDLNDANQQQMKEAFTPFVTHARDASGKARSARRRSKASDGRNTDVRAWARLRGHKVSDKGRIPAAIQAEYDSLH